MSELTGHAIRNHVKIISLHENDSYYHFRRFFLEKEFYYNEESNKYFFVNDEDLQAFYTATTGSEEKYTDEIGFIFYRVNEKFKQTHINLYSLN